MLVLIADASQNAMSGSYQSISEGCLLVATIAGWNYGLDWVAFHFAVVRRWVEPAPLQLIKDGRMLRKHMRKELITSEELWAQLREHGVKELSEVQSAFMESSGEISVLKKSSED